MSANIDKVVMHNGSLYDYTNGTYCGVLIKEEVMKKLVKLQQRHLEDVKRLLIDEAEKSNVFPSAWTLHYPEGKQTSIRYIDTSVNLIDSIKNATITSKPKHVPVVFIAGSMSEAEAMADLRASCVSADGL